MSSQQRFQLASSPTLILRPERGPIRLDEYRMRNAALPGTEPPRVVGDLNPEEAETRPS